MAAKPAMSAHLGGSSTSQVSHSTNTGRRNTLHYDKFPLSDVERTLLDIPPPQPQRTLRTLQAAEGRRRSSIASMASASSRTGSYVGGPIRRTGPVDRIPEEEVASSDDPDAEGEYDEEYGRHKQSHLSRPEPHVYNPAMNSVNPVAMLRKPWNTDLSKIPVIGSVGPVIAEASSESGTSSEDSDTESESGAEGQDGDEGEQSEGDVEMESGSESAVSYRSPSSISSISYSDDEEPYTGRMGGLNASGGMLGAQMRNLARVLHFMARAKAVGIDVSNFEALAEASPEQWEEVRETTLDDAEETSLVMVETLLGLSVEQLCELSERAAGLRQELKRLGVNIGASLETDYIFDGCI